MALASWLSNHQIIFLKKCAGKSLFNNKNLVVNYFLSAELHTPTVSLHRSWRPLWEMYLPCFASEHLMLVTAGDVNMNATPPPPNVSCNVS